MADREDRIQIIVECKPVERQGATCRVFTEGPTATLTIEGPTALVKQYAKVVGAVARVADQAEKAGRGDG